MTVTRIIIERHLCVGTTMEGKTEAFFEDHPVEDGWRCTLAGPSVGGWHATFEREIERASTTTS